MPGAILPETTWSSEVLSERTDAHRCGCRSAAEVFEIRRRASSLAVRAADSLRRLARLR